MAKNLNVNDKVYVPCSLFEETSCYTALYPTEVVTTNLRSVKVRLPDGTPSQFVANSKVHKTCGTWIITIGDLDTEFGLLNPLSKSVLQFCRLLYSSDTDLLHTRISSSIELSKLWDSRANAFEFIILIGHGGRNGFYTATDEWINSDDFISIINTKKTKPKNFLSLCCETGMAPLARKFSTARVCKSYIAPFHSIHGAIASQFCQTYLTQLLLEGRMKKTAFNFAKRSVPGSSKFRFWENGKLKK